MEINKTFTQYNYPLLEKVYWKDVRGQVARVEAKFAKLVDELDPGKEFPLYRARYPYGCVIVKEGVFHIPTPDGQLMTLDDARFPNVVREDFDYSGIEFPAGMVLNNSIELLFEFRDKICPWRLYKAGTIFALWGYLEQQPTYNPAQIYHITSGARAIFMLPNIGDLDYFKRVQRDFSVHLDPPKDLLSQWSVFTAITRHPAAKCTWHSELLFFTSNWLRKLNSDDKEWAILARYLLQYAWQNSAHARNNILYDFAFSMTQAIRNLKPNPYLADTVKYLLAIAASGFGGGIPGSAVPLDEIGAPIKLLQKVFLETYRLEDYPPIIIHQANFSLAKNSRPVYYSLRFPTTVEFSPHSRKLAITLHDLRELHHLMRIYLEEIRRGRARLEKTPYGLVAERVVFDFFHSQPDSYGWIRLSSEMPNEDSTLMQGFVDYKDRKFPAGATFCRGCVRIALKKDLKSL